ncbi:CDP-alcohol phosphatidyltransferase family protein [bacterium]|nr:CDP-alcohol phosphatidyltransferase family protein [bacterium]
MFKDRVQKLGRRPLEPLAALLLRMGLTPNALTMTGMVLSIGAGLAIIRGRLISAGFLLLAGGLCDILDGSMARRGGRSTVRGAFLDSTLDRISEIAVFFGLIIFYQGNVAFQAWTFLALTGSLMTSYARARAEGLGLSAKVGLLERPERVILLILALLLNSWTPLGRGTLDWVLVLLAIFTWFTTMQRLVHVLIRNHES